jgi:hypothetical protein
MKTTMFLGTQMQIGKRNGIDGHISAVIVPTLSAYAVEYAEFMPPRHLDAGYIQFHSGAEFEINGEKIQFGFGFTDIPGDFATSRLVIHYHGIRDYESLFPQITDASLRARLGQFYQEAEATFDSCSWLAFGLMSAAVYEGLLMWRMSAPREDFVNLINRAMEQKFITDIEAATLHLARGHRNLVHASQHGKPYVTRAEAMDMRTALDGLIRRLSIV